MPECDRCRTEIQNEAVFTCTYCEGTFCGDHRLPEKHNCFAAKGHATIGPDLMSGGSDDSVTIGGAGEDAAEEEQTAEEEAEADDDSPQPEDFGPQTECERCYRPIPEGNDYCERCEREMQNQGSGQSSCKECGEPIDAVSGYACKRCECYFCSDHRLPENHVCETVSTSSDSSAVDMLLNILLLPFWGLLQLGSGLLAAASLLLDVRVLLAIFVVVPVVLFGAVGVGVLGSGDVSGTPAEPVVSGIEGAISDYEESRTLNTSEAESLAHQEVNDRRDANGIARLRYDPLLAQIARNHSQDMANRDYVGHTSPDGVGFPMRAPPGCSPGAENIHMTYWRENIETHDGTERIESESQLARSAVDAWMNSQGHRRNLLDPRFRYQGIGIATDGDEVYITQVFCGA